MRTKVRIKLLMLIMTALIPLLCLTLLGGIYSKNMPLLVFITLFSLFVVWVIGDHIIINNYIKLEEANALKSKYMFISSHDLRTPMTAIKGLISMIVDGDYGPINKNLEEPLSDIKTSVERLILLMNNLLILSRVQDGRLKFDMTNINIKKQIDEVINLITPAAKQKNIMLDSIDCSSIMVQADSEKLKQILCNSVNHLLTTTHEKQIIISSEIRKGNVYICITDMDKKSKIEFKEKNNSALDGTGLDFYIAQEFIKKWGGRFWLNTSEDKKKMAFTFFLPIDSSSLV